MRGNFTTNQFFILDTALLEEEQLSKFIKKKIQLDELDQYQDCIAIFDEKGEVKYSNNQFASSFGSPGKIPFEQYFLKDSETYPLAMLDEYLVRYSHFVMEEQHFILLAYQNLTVLHKTIQYGSLMALMDILISLLKGKIENDFLVNNLYDLVTIADKNGIIVRTNSKIHEKFGIDEDDIIGKDTLKLVQTGVITNSVTQEVLKHKSEIIMTQNTQRGRCLTVTGYPVFTPEGDIFRVINISRDITELNGLEKKLRESETIMSEYEKQLKRLREELVSPNLLVTSNLKMRDALTTIKNITDVDSTVLIEGETGVGKGVLATTIHNTSTRKTQPFIKINCASIPASLFESEIFGYEKGSFTGALGTGKSGLVLEANHGTLFLDEIGDLPYPMQAKILDLIQSKSFYPVGSAKEKKVDVRIIAATNKDLKSKIRSGEFREDLYYRLAVIPIYVPPLRERKDEIPIIVEDLLADYNNRFNKSKYISRDALKVLEAYDWPGNIRELENLIERLVATTAENLITPDSLPRELLEYQSSYENSLKIVVNDLVPLETAYDFLEKAMFEKAMEKKINQSQLSDILGVHRTTVARKMKKYFDEEEIF